MSALSTTATILRRTAREFMADRCPQMAAAIAYHVLFSVIPIVALLIAIFGFMIRVPQIQQRVLEGILSNVPIKAGLVIDSLRAVSNASAPLTILGIVGLLWPAVGLFGTIRDSLNVAWGIRRGRGIVRQHLLDLASVVGLALLIAVSITGTIALHSLRNASVLVTGGYSPQVDLLWNTAAFAFPALISFVALLVLYRYVPNVRHGFRDVWPGALVAALLFELGKHGFTWYMANWSQVELLYGALGTVMLFLLWVYLSAMILLIGAELASVWEELIRRRAEPPVVVAPPTQRGENTSTVAVDEAASHDLVGRHLPQR